MNHTSRHRVALALVAAALGASVVVPTATAAPPDPVTQQVVVVAGDGDVTKLEVTEPELAALRADPSAGPVVERGQVVHTALAQSVPKVGAPSLWAAGQRGAGKVIVVIDTGVAPTFGGTVVGQACFAATQVGQVLEGHCGPGGDVTEAFDGTCFDLGVCSATAGDVLDPTAARPCGVPPAGAADCYHGTAVAAVAARHEPTPGVAPDAGVYAIRVFDPIGTTASLVDLMLALDHTLQLADAGMDIAAVNLSVATAYTYPTACDAGPGAPAEAEAFRLLFDELRRRGIGNAVASGNSGSLGGIALPACVSNAVSVGATDLDDQLADFGNRGPTLDLLAPGADEGNGSLEPMEIPGSPLTTWAGTSFSAPHVAGAFALVGPQYPKASIDQIVGLLRSTGVPVREDFTGATYRRLQLDHLEAGLAAGLLFRGSAGVSGTTRVALGDLDGDGRADVISHGPGSGPDAVSYGRPTWGFDRRARTLDGDLRPLVGQLRGAADGPEDVLWYAPGSAADLLWVGQAGRTPPSQPVAVSGTYTPVVGDFDGDGWDDVLWYAPGGTADPIWFGGATAFTKGVTDIRGSYTVWVADFDGDTRDDLLLYGSGSSQAVWMGSGDRSFERTTVSAPGSRRVDLGDLNGDLRADVLLHGPGTSTDHLLLGTDSDTFTPVALTVRGTYQPVVADLDRDGVDDVLWYAPGSAPDPLWSDLADGTPARRHTTSVSGSHAPLVGDVDGDGWDDIVWANPATALTAVWWSYVPPES